VVSDALAIFGLELSPSHTRISPKVHQSQSFILRGTFGILLADISRDRER
jgi:hypothetical protein